MAESRAGALVVKGELSAEIETHATTARRWQVPALVGVFALSRVAYWASGVRFDENLLNDRLWQLLPSHLLQHDLWRSLWYLHAQPPLFNALAAVGLRAPIASGTVFNWFFVACGLALTLTMFSLMREMRVPPTFAFVMTTLFVVRPTVVLYENWFFYTYPVALALTLTAWFLARFVRTANIWYAFGFGVTLAVLGLTRATFHPVYLLAAAVFVFFVCPRPQRGRVAAVVAMPLLVVVGLFVKNWVLFGQPTSSTWAGMNFARMVFSGEQRTVEAEVKSGQLSTLLSHGPFQSLATYGAPLPRTGVPALDIVAAGTPPRQTHPNFNNLAYIDISNEFGSQAWGFVRRHPMTYVTHLMRSYRTAYAAPADYTFVALNRTHIASLVDAEGRLLGQLHSFGLAPVRAPLAPGWTQIEWLVVVQYLAVVVAGLAVVVAFFRGKRWHEPWIPATIAFVAGTVLFTSVASNALELGENMRFRFETDPLVWVVCAALIATAWRSRVASHQSASS